MKLRVILACVIACMGACYREKPDDRTAQRIAKLEQQLAAQDKAIGEMRQRADSAELALLAQQLADLQRRLDEVKAAPAAAPHRREPDKALTYAVPIKDDPVFGAGTAKVTLVMAIEFDCPYCRRAWDTVDELRKLYGKDLRVVYKAYVVHAKTATYPAQAACAAQHQGRWRQLADLMWAKAFDVRVVVANAFAPEHIDGLANEAGLDLARYKAEVGPCASEVKDEIAQLVKLGVSATPTFFINGRYLAGALPIDKFTALVDEELAKATAAQKRGVKPERYYEQEILGKGLREVP